MMRYDLGLVAHDAKKGDMTQWIGEHIDQLRSLRLVATASTGALIARSYPGLDIRCLKSGPLGGDQEIGALIANEKMGALIFFIDPLSPLPHDVDVKALTRLAVLYNIPFACNRTTADHLLASGPPKRENERP
ncbi:MULTISPECIES: methylglyoxal synthase [unclassified Sphingobium]|uniref:methylglyoxal synthase n=1 Tax=unclassified Sphingobium TaxID=2611147 RepID=UPI0035A70B2F